MDWKKLFRMQKQLDDYIENNHEVQSKDLFDKKILALLVEVGELANETRCFKFWSTKPKSETPIIIEEYVDGLHFILSLGLIKGFNYESNIDSSDKSDLTVLFNQVFEKTIAFKNKKSGASYQQLFQTYLELGQALGFNELSIQTAYHDKNKVNYERQDEGY